MRSDRAAQQNRRRALLAELQRSFSVPRRHEVEHVVGRVLDPNELEVRVPVVDVDELRAAFVGARCDRTRELLFAEAAAEIEDLAGLDVDAEIDDEVGVAFEAIVHGKAILTSARMLAHARTGRNRSIHRIPEPR